MGKRSEHTKTGKRFGEHNQIEILEWEGHYGGKKRARMYPVLCHICKHDPELFGDGKFYSNIWSIGQGIAPCGCSTNTQWSEEQYKILCKRATEKIDCDFVGWAEPYKHAGTKVSMICRKHATLLNNSSISGLIHNHVKGCKQCSKERMHIRKNVEKDIDDIMEAGQLLPGTIFSACHIQQRKGEPHAGYSYTCPVCSHDDMVKSGVCSGIFHSTTYSLKRGQVPCRHRTKCGFSANNDGYLYILKAVATRREFAGYGITSLPEDRMSTHAYELKRKGFEITEHVILRSSGVIVQKVEKEIIRKFPTFTQEISGFKKEATHASRYEEIILFAQSLIKEYEYIHSSSYS